MSNYDTSKLRTNTSNNATYDYNLLILWLKGQPMIDRQENLLITSLRYLIFKNEDTFPMYTETISTLLHIGMIIISNQLYGKNVDNFYF